MTDSIGTFCPWCDTEVRANIAEKPSALRVRGEDVSYAASIAICPNCGEAIGDSRLEQANLERAYDVYRSRHGIVAPSEIRDLREAYGLSLRDFSKFLGFGEQTAYRYEHGSIPDASHNTTILSARTSAGARLLLQQNGNRLSKKSSEKIRYYIAAIEDGHSEETLVLPRIEMLESAGTSAANGFRRLDLDRVAALVYLLSEKCTDLYWTKLQKALFFADMLFFETHTRSMTGLKYAHATFGPVMDGMEEIRLLLSERGTVMFAEKGWGEVLVPLREESIAFSDDELSIIDKVADFVNTFDSASDLSGFSHGLSCWSKTPNGRIIDYTSTEGEIGKAIDKRLQHDPVSR